MRFLADMGVDTRIVQWLKQNGHDAKHLRDEGLHRIPNKNRGQASVIRY
jgi:predicted nuclease of predicted toxin-antitoxin system